MSDPPEPAPSDEQLRATLFQPALLADVIAQLFAGEELYAQLPEGEPREEVFYRLAELWARLDPAGLLVRLDEHPLEAAHAAHAARLRAEALLELSRIDEAAPLLAAHEAKVGAAWELLRARLDFAQRRAESALARLDALLAGEPDLETRAAALGFRMRFRALQGDRGGAAIDRRALVTLLESHGATLSTLLVDVYGSYAALPERDAVVRHKIAQIVAETKAQLEADLDETQASLGPLPLHVHGLFVKLRGDPPRLASLATRLAGAQHLAGDSDGAYATLYYASQIGDRLLGDAAAPLHEAHDELQRLLGEARSADIAAALRRRADAFLTNRGRA